MTSSILQEAAAGRAIIQPWTVEQYHWAIETGFLEESSAFELLDGFIVRKDRAKAGEDPMTIGDRHRIVVTRLSHLAAEFEPHGCFLQSQQPVSVPPKNEPEPDAAIVRGKVDDYLEHPPLGRDVICVIEVADRSLSRDLGTKLRTYARARIPQYVVVDLMHDVVLVHTQPTPKGYPEPTKLRAGETLAIRTAKGQAVTVPVARLLPGGRPTRR
jgi:Uma2 family endonuclease